ncbi:hypothetical protein DPEC_G00026000 [Dallia pectoralis]|uniref:Uncharacterized protein n=1 Tax=Dallia pectoralis TaxID=75939 RepID=A0ACC2HHX3_DALPE|nr:hypothetical protein DPEC_G00026000 [Dallia pectoralis]
MERGHISVRRGVSCSPAGLRKPTQGGDTESLTRQSDWQGRDYRGVKGQETLASTNQLGRKTTDLIQGLTRSASLSEKELKEARVRSQIIATQLTVPSGGSNSRGVQLFNRRRQRVNAFTLESCGERDRDEEEEEEDSNAENDREKTEDGDTRNNNLIWREERGGASETDRELNFKNNCRTKPPSWSSTPGGNTGSEVTVSDIMEDPGSEPIYEEVDVIRERHFLPVNERVRKEVAANGSSYKEPNAPTETRNGFHSTQPTGPEIQNGERVSVSLSGPATAILNRTARPFFSPTNVQTTPPGSNSIPPAPTYPTPTLQPVSSSYWTPPCQAFTTPPPPSYPMPPLPDFPGHPPSQSLSSSNPMSPVVSPQVSLVPQYHPAPQVALGSQSQYIHSNTTVSQHIPPPTYPRPNTFIPYNPQPIVQQQQPIKTGILEEGAAAIRRTSTAKKSMFTFKEKPVMAPNPELLSLVQGNDERKKHGLRSVPDLGPEEELLALGAEASNFLAKAEVRAEASKVPEWSSCLKSSRTREPRGQHQPEQTLSNVSGKGAELFAKRQSRMEKYIVANDSGAGQMRSLSPTASLPPSWVYPSNMPGRVKAIANNTDLSAQLTRPSQTAQQVKRRPSQRAPTSEPVPEEPPLENGCTKIEMDLSRHKPYQLNPSLFIFNPVKDPTSTLPRGAPPPPKPLASADTYSRQATSYPSSHSYNSLPRFRQGQSPASQPTSRVVGGGDYYPPHQGGTAGPSGHRITSPVSAFSPKAGVQAPKPNFSAKSAGIKAQMRKESPPTAASTPTTTPQFDRQYSSPEGNSSSAVWSPTPQSTISTSRSPRPATNKAPSPVAPPWETRCQSPAVVNQTTKPFYAASLPRPKTSSTVTSPVSPWGSRSQSPNPNQTPKPFSATIISSNSRTSHPGSITSPLSPSPLFPSPLSPHWGSRCQSPIVSPGAGDSKANHRLLAKNIINAAKRKNSPSPGALSGHNTPISLVSGGSTTQQLHSSKPPFSPFQSRALGCRSPPFASPPPTPTGMMRSPVRLYNSRSLTDSDASVESEDSGLRSPGLHRSHNAYPRGWGGSLRVKRGSVGTDL